MSLLSNELHPLLFQTLRAAKTLLVGLRHFAAHPDEPLQLHSRDYLTWNREIKTPKAVAKWVLPIWSQQTLRGIAPEVYGKDPSPLEILGKVSVASYIRYLLYERGWSVDSITEHLVNLGYDRTSARPQARRAALNEVRERAKFLKERDSILETVGAVKLA